MREIKFRCWDNGRKVMVPYDAPSITACHNYLQIHNYEGKYCKEKEGRTTIPNFELMQYTGLKDKNGNEIYDGDLLEVVYYWGEEDYAEVCWNTKRAEWRLKRKGEYYESLGSCFSDGCCVWEVIGNIFETPELLKEDEK